MKARTLALPVLAALAAGSAALIALGPPERDVDLRSAVQVWSDVVRDVDHYGLVATRISAAQEMVIGQDIASQVTLWMTEAEDPKLQRYVAAVGARLAGHASRRQMRYRFHVVQSEVINAFALPGGNVYVTTGMVGFLHNEAELATILGHEISHIDRRHCVERFQYELAARKVVGRNLAALGDITHRLIAAPYSAQQELEADSDGALLAAQAGYDPRAARAVEVRFRTALPQGRPRPQASGSMVKEVAGSLSDALHQYFATHPPTADRIREFERLYARNAQAWRGHRFYVGTSNYKDRIARSRDARPGEWTTYGEPARKG